MAQDELAQMARVVEEEDDDEVLPVAPAATGTVARSAGLDADSVRGKLLQHVRSVLTDDLPVDSDTPLMDMGLDSLSAMDLQNLIATSFPFLPASTTILLLGKGIKREMLEGEVAGKLRFDYPTVRELVSHLVDQSQEAGL